jgi:N utilization substance protein A
MKSEFALAFNQVSYRRDWKIPATQNVEAEISLETGLARIFIDKVVVEEEVEDPQIEIRLVAARKRKADVQVDDILMVDVTPSNFGRIAAQTAKQVITQRLREAERESQFNRFSRQENEIIIGTVRSVNPRGVTLHLERTEEAHMPRREQIPGERYVLHQKIRVYVLEVRRTSRGPEIIVSRSHPLMLRRLLEIEVPEIRNGQVEINAVAREAGTRAKVAVSARQTGIDPVGACVGMRGMRIQTISNELHGERIDVVQWDEDPETFISNALSIPKIVNVTLDEHHPGGRTASVAVLDEHLSLAIGRSGQNARLSAKLTNGRIDIQGATEAAMWALAQVNETPDLLDALRSKAALIPRLAAIMRTHEEDRYPYTDEERNIIGTVIKAVREAVIARRNAERPGSSQARARHLAQRDADAERVKAKQDAQARVPRGAYKMPLEELGLSKRVYNHLMASGLESIGEVMEKLAVGDEPLLMINGIGVKALREIKDTVATSGLQLLDQGDTQDEQVAVDAAVEAEVAERTAEPETAAEVEEQIVAKDLVAGEKTDEPVAEAEPADDVEKLVEDSEETALEVDSSGDEGFTASLDDVAFADEDDEEDADISESGERQGKKRRRRTVMFDDASGETFVVRKHRTGSDSWDEYSEDY